MTTKANISKGTFTWSIKMKCCTSGKKKIIITRAMRGVHGPRIRFGNMQNHRGEFLLGFFHTLRKEFIHHKWHFPGGSGGGGGGGSDTTTYPSIIQQNGRFPCSGHIKGDFNFDSVSGLMNDDLGNVFLVDNDWVSQQRTPRRTLNACDSLLWSPVRTDTLGEDCSQRLLDAEVSFVT